mgnify:CR=1 FL=1
MFNKLEKNWLIVFIGTLVIAIFYIGFEFGYEYANPCVKYGTDCEMICTGEGTPAYDCWEECPCIERKYKPQSTKSKKID